MQGIGVSPGIAIGTVRLISKKQNAASGILLDNDEMKMKETDRFDKSIKASINEIDLIIKSKGPALTRAEIEILATQIEFLSDPQIRSNVTDKITRESRSAFDSVIEVIDSLVSLFSDMEDQYMKERASDIKDIGERILKNLNPDPQPFHNDLPENTIIISTEITPSDSISLDATRIAGFATVKGGQTSHTAIIARSKGIPAVVACGEELMEAGNNDTIIIDGSSGEVILRPDTTTEEAFRRKQKEYAERMAFMNTMKDLPAVTTDGVKIRLSANIAGPDDLEKVFENGGEGVGLLRTEFLFMGRDSMPDEEEQFNFYRDVAIKSRSLPVIIRTLDAGGDKPVPYLNISEEKNPFMGYRAIRLCLDQKELFMTQLRAVLRASAFGNIKIMFPMISNISEFREARKCVQRAKDELSSEGIMFNDRMETGIMIEIPAAAIMADQLAAEVDFFSIGTNDLVQYTLAVDRMNEKVASLYNHFNPAVLRLIDQTLQQARLHNIHAGVCGEMASDPLATLLLLGMGLEDFSTGAASIPMIKQIIRRTDKSKAMAVWNKIKEMDNSDSIAKFLKEVSL